MKTLDHADVVELLGAVNLKKPFGLRDHAMIRLALFTGLRVAELVGLNVGDVRGKSWLQLPAAIAKGRRGREIPLSRFAIQAVSELIHFLDMRGFKSGDQDPLLQDRCHHRLSVGAVQRAVRSARVAAALGIKATPHVLRHSFASECSRRGSLRAVQQVLGHRYLSSTEVYLHTRPEDLVAVVQRD